MRADRRGLWIRRAGRLAIALSAGALLALGVVVATDTGARKINVPAQVAVDRLAGVEHGPQSVVGHDPSETPERNATLPTVGSTTLPAPDPSTTGSAAGQNTSSGPATSHPAPAQSPPTLTATLATASPAPRTSQASTSPVRTEPATSLPTSLAVTIAATTSVPRTSGPSTVVSPNYPVVVVDDGDGDGHDGADGGGDSSASTRGRATTTSTSTTSTTTPHHGDE